MDNKYDDQCSISFELLALLNWIIEHDAAKLKKIITKAFTMGLKEEILAVRQLHGQQEALEEINRSVIDFFSLLESLLSEQMQARVAVEARQNNLLSSVNKIDTSVCGDDLVRTSLEKATSVAEKSGCLNAKELLYKELLKSWNPHDQELLN